MTQKPVVGLVGVGRMGANMALRLHDCGYRIGAVSDRDAEAAEKLCETLQIATCFDLREMTRRCDVIITVVSDDQAMRDIYALDRLFADAAGKLFINCATITPSVHIELMAQARALGAEMLEVPMASSIPQAREGSLYLMCAGSEATYAKAGPLLDALSAKRIYTGPAGSASRLKALVNMVMNINTAALAEGLGLADALGLDLNLVRQAFAQTGANSHVLETDGEDMQHREYSVFFSAAHAAKDSTIAWKLGIEKGLPMVLAAATRMQYETMVLKGLGELDKSAIAELTFQNRS